MYYKYYLLIERNLEEEINALLRAAWCSDDWSQAQKDASEIRRMLIPKLMMRIKNQSENQEDDEMTNLILIDCYRRLSEFDRVIELWHSEAFKDNQEFESARQYQRDLATAKDNRRYDFASALEAYPVKTDDVEQSNVSNHLDCDTAEKELSQDTYIPLYKSIKEAFEHENEPDFLEKLTDYLFHMPANRNTLYQTMDAMKEHKGCKELIIPLFDLLDLMTAEEREWAMGQRWQ